MRQMPFKAALLVVALAVLPALGPGTALANHVNCGDTITQSTTLDSDLLNCPGNGVVIGADGITLDLNGHVIDGVAFQSQTGVDNGGGYDGVTIENGAIQEFFNGIAFQHVANSRVTGVGMRDVFFGVRLESSDLNRIDRNDISSLSGGVVFFALGLWRLPKTTRSSETRSRTAATGSFLLHKHRPRTTT
jgi:hypothetical protein